MDKTWVKRISGRHEKIRMFCFPHAGAGAYVYSDWKNYISDEIGVYAVKLPGREKRIREPLIDNAAAVCEGFIRSIKEDMDVPYVLFGHSMGGILAYETLKQIAKQKLPLPRRIIFSASSLTGFHNIPDISGFDDDRLADYLLEMGGTDSTLLSNEGFRECFFPIIRNDYKLVHDYRADKLNISVPVLALSGTKDPFVERDKMLSLKKYAPSFKIVDIEGGHFFIEDKKKICSLLNKELLEDRTCVPHEVIHRPLRNIGISSFGLGGMNAHLILSCAPSSQKNVVRHTEFEEREYMTDCVRRYLSGGGNASPAAAAFTQKSFYSEGEILSRILDILAEVTGEDDIDPNDTFDESGIVSMDQIVLSSRLSEMFSVPVSIDDLYSEDTAALLAGLIFRRQADTQQRQDTEVEEYADIDGLFDNL